MDDYNSIDKALGLRHIEETTSEMAEETYETLPDIVVEGNITSIVPINVEEDETFRDIERARSNIENIISQGGSSLTEMVNLAKQSENPKAFEVAAILMKTMLEANKDFVEMSMKKKYHREELEGPKQEVSQTNVTNNNLILSTSELLKLIKEGSTL
jgi:rubrerythrin